MKIIKNYKKILLLIVIIVGFSLISCEEKLEMVPNIMELRLHICDGDMIEFTGKTPYYITSNLVDFNKKNYSNVDSAKILITNAKCEPGLYTNYYLYDVSNNHVLLGTEQQVGGTELRNYYSKDIWNDLLNKTTSYGVMGEKKTEGNSADFQSMFLIIYMNN